LYESIEQMSENDQYNAPSIESDTQAPSVSMDIVKEYKQTKKRSTKEFLDDHVQKDFGQSLVDSISRLISESKDEAQKKPSKKKKKMTPEMLEQCRRNLAKGRETLKQKKQPKSDAPPPKSQPKPETPKAEPTPKPKPKAEAPKPVSLLKPKPVPQPEPEPEQVTFRLSDLLF
jgi:hypothetical protein